MQTIHVDQVTPLPGLVMVEPIWEAGTQAFQHRSYESQPDAALPAITLHLPDQTTQKYTQSGWVLKVGRCKYDLKEGDLVVFPMFVPRVVPLGPGATIHYNEQFFIIHEDDILMVVEEW